MHFFFFKAFSVLLVGCDVSWLLHAGFLWLPLVGVPLLPCVGFACSAPLVAGPGLWTWASVVAACGQAGAHGFVALQHVAYSWTRDPTGVSCIASGIFTC